MEIKTTEDLVDHFMETDDPIDLKKWVAVDDLIKLKEEMKLDCNNCFTGLTKDSDFEMAFGTICNVVFNRLNKELGEWS